jgi:flagellar hook-length control protein FliK
MNINQSGGSSSPSNSPQDIRLSKHQSLDMEIFADQLFMAQKNVDWYSQEDSVEEKERLYEEQLKKYRALDDKEDELNATAFLNLINQKNNNEHVVTTRSFLKTETDQKFINEKVDLQKTHLRVPTVDQGQDEFNTEDFADLIDKKTAEKTSGRIVTDARESGLSKETIDTRLDAKLAGRSAIDLLAGQKNQQPADISIKNIKNPPDSTTSKNNIAISSQTSSQVPVKERQNPIQKPLSPQIAKGTPAINSSQSNTVDSRQRISQNKTIETARPTNENMSVKDMQNNIRYMISNNRDQMTIRLVPAHLGKLEIQIKKVGERITGRFKVENKQAKEAIKARLSTLASELEEQGIQVDEISILINGDANSNESFSFGDNREQHQNALNRQNDIDSPDQTERHVVTNQSGNNSTSEKDLNLYA